MSDLGAELQADLGGDRCAKTLTDIRNIVRFRGDLRNTTRFPNADIDKEIQAAFGEGYELVANTNEGYYITEETVLTTANQRHVVLPTCTWKTHAVDRLDGDQYIPVQRIGIKDRNRFSATAGKPEGHRLTKRGIELYPTPDAIYTLRLTITPTAPLLSDDVSEEFYNGWEEYTIFGALVRLYLNQNRDASEWERQLQKQAARLSVVPSERNATGPEYLNLYESDGADWDLPPTWSW